MVLRKILSQDIDVKQDLVACREKVADMFPGELPETVETNLYRTTSTEKSSEMIIVAKSSKHFLHACGDTARQCLHSNPKEACNQVRKGTEYEMGLAEGFGITRGDLQAFVEGVIQISST